MGMEPAAAAFRGLWLLKAKQPRQDHERPVSSSTGLKSSHGSWQGSETSPGWEKGWVSLAHRHVAKESGSPSTRASIWPGIDGAGVEAEPHEPENGRSWGTGTWARARWCCPCRGCNVAGSCERRRLLNASQEGQEDAVPPRVLSASEPSLPVLFQVPARCFSPWDAVQGVNKAFFPLIIWGFGGWSAVCRMLRGWHISSPSGCAARAALPVSTTSGWAAKTWDELP